MSLRVGLNFLARLNCDCKDDFDDFENFIFFRKEVGESQKHVSVPFCASERERLSPKTASSLSIRTVGESVQRRFCHRNKIFQGLIVSKKQWNMLMMLSLRINLTFLRSEERIRNITYLDTNVNASAVCQKLY